MKCNCLLRKIDYYSEMLGTIFVSTEMVIRHEGDGETVRSEVLFPYFSLVHCKSETVYDRNTCLLCCS